MGENQVKRRARKIRQNSIRKRKNRQ